MPDIIEAEQFLFSDPTIPIIDVRSPSEFHKGHIKGAVNIPLFNDEERARIGTLYHKSGRKDALLKGLEITGSKLRDLADKGLQAAKDRNLKLYCWRGGMRSSSVAWLYETCGLKCTLLSGGYKAFRSYIHSYLGKPFKFIVIGGKTGCGKTEILREISKQQFQFLDLEKLARHKGSAFGSLGEQEQDSNEQFENEIFFRLSEFDESKPVLVEDESRNIGRNIIPSPLYDTISGSGIIVLEMDKKLRTERLLREYGNFDSTALISSVEKLRRRMGGQNTNDTIDLIRKGNFREAVSILLNYYDKAYTHSLQRSRHRSSMSINLISAGAGSNAEYLTGELKKLFNADIPD